MDHGSVSADLTVRVGQLVGPYLIPGAVDRVANLPPARCAHRVGKFDARARSGRESADHRPRRLTRGTGGEVPLGRPAAAHGLSRRTNTASSRFMRRRYPRGRPAADLRALRESPQSEHRDGPRRLPPVRDPRSHHRVRDDRVRQRGERPRVRKPFSTGACGRSAPQRRSGTSSGSILA